MTFLFAHWWTLTILTLAAFLIGVSIAGLAGLTDTTIDVGYDESDRSIAPRRQPPPSRGTDKPLISTYGVTNAQGGVTYTRVVHDSCDSFPDEAA